MPRYSLQARFTNFVDWIKADLAREEEFRARRGNIRNAISSRAKADGLTIASTPNSGSFATRTGLRRHMRGQSEVEGQDVDVPFVVEPKTNDEQKLGVLLPRFEKYARAAYSGTEIDVTKSSVRLHFADNVNFDLVPLLATSNAERQILIRTDGERRETSVQKHVDFITGRSSKSNDLPGRVKFNEIVRLLKWWRCFREASAGTLEEVPSFLVNLLAAKSFDERSVKETYAETIADWFGFLARLVRRRNSVAFSDFAPTPQATPGSLWSVHDPVNPANNITSRWNELMCVELAEWFEEGRDALCDAIAAFEGDRENDGIEDLVRVFGTPFRHHSEPA